MIRNMMDLSTAHLPERLGTGDALVDLDGVSAYGLADYGWLMWVPDDPDAWAGDFDIPPEVLVIQRFARQYGCDYVRFDPDVDPVEALPRWEW